MTSRKRWQQIYAAENPFRLPQSLVRTLKHCVRNLRSREPDTIQYLWIHLADDIFVPPQYRSESRNGNDLTTEEWLNVLDESASLGAESIIISIGVPLSERPEVWAIVEWAQTVHNMMVGVYVCGGNITEDEVRRLAHFEKEKTRLFADSCDIDNLRYADEKYGLQLCVADGLMPGEPALACHLPESMSCVCSSGQMYTCGLVLGNDQFHFGHVHRKRLDGIMADPSLPHHIPEGTAPELPRRCNACPPLMERRMRGMNGH